MTPNYPAGGRKQKRRATLWTLRSHLADDRIAPLPTVDSKDDVDDRVRVSEKHLLLEVELVGSDPRIWRRFSVPPDLSLSDLHHVLQLAMGWESCHLYEFSRGREKFGPPDEYSTEEEHTKDDAQVEVQEIFRRKGQRLNYLYDFGDSWEHVITCHSKCAPSTSGAPQVVAGERACPPEDIGGMYNYMETLRAHTLQGKSHSSDNEPWFTEFDPAAFDLDRVNRRLLAYHQGEEDDDFDDETLAEEGALDSGVWDLPVGPGRAHSGSFALPVDDFGEPILYDPNDSRGPDPARWTQMTEEEHLAAILAYHEHIGRTGANPELHASAHALVEYHLLPSGLPSAQKALKRALDAGLCRHDAIHALSATAIGRITEQLEETSSLQSSGPSSQSDPLADARLDAAYRAFNVADWLSLMHGEDD